jgi:hypothetical protein
LKKKLLILSLVVVGIVVLGTFAAVAGTRVATPKPKSPARVVAAPVAASGTITGETEKPESNEQAKPEEKGENLPNGGHADPEGANVDHQFEGVE